MSRRVEEGLASEDPELRRRAVAALPDDDLADRAARLALALGDVDWRVRKEAVRVATEHAERLALLPSLVDALCQGENVGLRNAALEALEHLGPRAARALLDALPSAPLAARKFIVAALGFAGGAGVEELAALSRDDEPNTAQAAIEALARVGGPRAEEALRAHLSSPDPVQRLAALEGLERLEAPLDAEELAPLLEDRLVRRLAVRVLGFSDDPSAARALFDAIDDAGTATAAEAATALGRLLERGGPAAREVARGARALPEETLSALRSIAAVGRDAPRRAATEVLLFARDREVLSTAAELAADDRLPPVALEAIRAWGVEAVEPLLELAGALGPRARAAALEMAAELASADRALAPATRASVERALREALEDADPIVVSAACSAMITWASSEDAAALARAAVRLPESAARLAGRALERLAREAPDAVERALSPLSLDGPVGAALLPAVAALGGPAATDRLQAALNADDARARRAAVMALPKLGGARAAELAGFALADEDVDVQVTAVQVLAQLVDDGGEPLGAEQLRLAARAQFDPVVAAAARALGAIGDRASIPVLRELVAEGRAGVAAPAMESLRALSDPGLDDLLVEALGQSDEELVKEALRAIAERAGSRRAARVALALEHPAWDVRQLAAQLLSEIGGEGAAAALRDRLAREADAGVRAAIERAIEAVEGAR